MKTSFLTAALVLAVVFVAEITIYHSNANAFPLPKHGWSTQTLPHTFTASGYDFEGIVALSNCSGALIQFDSSLDDDPAMVLTNGHCLETGMPDPDTFVYGKASSRSFTLLNSNASSAGRVVAKRIIYSTMTGTDLTLYQLNESFKQIRNRTGIRALVLMSNRPSVNDKIQVISGYWKRGYTCGIERFAYELREGDWTMKDSIKYSEPGCEVIGGTSGSPVIRSGTRTVIGVNNTGNDNGQRCTENNPCEIDQNGNVTYKRGWSYGQQTHQIYSCLNANREVDLSISGCELYH